jgi:hypothetical protein
VIVAKIFTGQLADPVAFTTLLTLESLLFAGMGVALTLSGAQSFTRNLAISPKALGLSFAALITAVGVGAILMWTSVFAEPWPCDFRGALVALIVLGTIGAEIAFAWILARGIAAPQTPSRV